MNVTGKHHLLAALPQTELVRLIREAADDNELLLWEMIGLGHFYWAVRAGPLTAIRLGIRENEIIGYHTPERTGHVLGGAIGDLMVDNPNQAPTAQDIIGTLRWQSRLQRPQ
jgi:hypothetical protein